MVPTTLSNPYMFIVPLSMIGSGVLRGTHGHRLGTGGIILLGGMHTPFGRMITIGIIAMRSIITMAVAVSAMHPNPVLQCVTCVHRSAVATMQSHIPTVLSVSETRA